MTKLVKNLIIGGTGTAVIGGAGAGVGVSLSNKKAEIRNAQPVARVTETQVAKTYVAPMAIPQQTPMLNPTLIPQQVLPDQLIPFAIPKGIEGQVDPMPIPAEVKGETPILPPKGIEGQINPVAVIKPTVPAGAFVFGGRSSVPALINHPPLRGTYQTHEGIHHLALDSDMQLIPELPAQPKIQAVPYVVPAMQQEVYKNTLGDPYIQNELVSQNVAVVVWAVDDHQVPFLYKAPVAPTATPSMVPGLVPTATPTQVLPEQKVPMMINNYGQPAASDWYATAKDHDHYAVPTITPSLKDEVKPVAQPYAVPAVRNVEVMSQVVLKDGMMTAPILIPTIGSTPYITPSLKTSLVPYAVPGLKSSSEEVVSSDVDSISIDPASKLAPAYIVGSVRQPIFEVITGQSKPLVDTIRADYHIHEGFNHAEFIDGYIQLTPTLTPTPSAVPYLVPELPVISTDPSEKEADADEVSLTWTPTEVEQQESSVDSDVTLTTTPHNVYEAHNTLVESLINHLHNHCTIQQAVESVFREVAAGHHQGYEQEDYSNIWETLSHHVSMHTDRTQHVSLTMNDFRTAFNNGFANLRQSMPSHFDTFDHLHTFLLGR